jgi:hypothetical protein
VQPTSSTADVERATPALDYLSRAARILAVPDPVQEYFGPVVGRWHDLHAEAGRWRHAASQVEELGEKLTAPLGGLDAGWDGRVADTFVEHMRTIGAAGRSASGCSPAAPTGSPRR